MFGDNDNRSIVLILEFSLPDNTSSPIVEKILYSFPFAISISIVSCELRGLG